MQRFSEWCIEMQNSFCSNLINLYSSSFKEKRFGNNSSICKPNIEQATFGSKIWDKRLKFCMQPPMEALYTDHKENFGSEVFDLNQKSRFWQKNRKRLAHVMLLKFSQNAYIGPCITLRTYAHKKKHFLTPYCTIMYLGVCTS